MPSFITAHLALLILVGTAFIFLIGVVSMLHSFLVSQRLHHLSIDIITNDPETLQHTPCRLSDVQGQATCEPLPLRTWQSRAVSLPVLLMSSST